MTEANQEYQQDLLELTQIIGADAVDDLTTGLRRDEKPAIISQRLAEIRESETSFPQCLM